MDQSVVDELLTMLSTTKQKIDDFAAKLDKLVKTSDSSPANDTTNINNQLLLRRSLTYYRSLATGFVQQGIGNRAAR